MVIPMGIPLLLPTRILVFMYPCIHVHMYSGILVSWYSCIHEFMYSRIHVSAYFMYPCILVFMYPCIHVFMYLCIHISLTFLGLPHTDILGTLTCLKVSGLINLKDSFKKDIKFEGFQYYKNINKSAFP